MAHDVRFRNPPVMENAIARSSRPVETPRFGATQRRTILLIEDEDPFRELVKAFLEEEGFSVHAERDGRFGTQWLKQNPVDLVLTDLCMPHTDGLELLIALRQCPSRVPIIVMSGGVAGDTGGILRAARLLGAASTMAKPFALEQLRTVVREALGERSEPAARC